jgi:hypothetical protein
MKLVFTIFLFFSSIILVAQNKKIKLEEQTFLDVNDSIIGYKIIEYDSLGRKVSTYNYDKDWNTQTHSIYQYASNYWKETYYDEHKVIEEIFEHFTDEYGNDTLLKYEYPKRLNSGIEKFKYYYEPLSKKVTKAEAPIGIILVTYNSKGLISSKQTNFGSPKKLIYYTYDAVGRKSTTKFTQANLIDRSGEYDKEKLVELWKYEYAKDSSYTKATICHSATYNKKKYKEIILQEYIKEGGFITEETVKKNEIFEKKTKYKYTFY